MLRALVLTVLICAHCGLMPSMAAKTVSIKSDSSSQKSSRAISTTSDPSNTPLHSNEASEEPTDSSDNDEKRYYHPAEEKKPYVIEEYNHQSRDGSYEYKYILSNGVSRYEKSFWKKSYKGKKFLARKGFYSHPLPNHKFLTVFYTADEHGFQQDTTKYTSAAPTLPKYLNVPQLEFPEETSTIITTTTTTTRKPITTTKTTTGTSVATTTQRLVEKPSEFNWIY